MGHSSAVAVQQVRQAVCGHSLPAALRWQPRHLTELLLPLFTEEGVVVIVAVVAIVPSTHPCPVPDAATEAAGVVGGEPSSVVVVVTSVSIWYVSVGTGTQRRRSFW